MKIIFLLIVLFLLLAFLYGIYASIGALVQKIKRVAVQTPNSPPKSPGLVRLSASAGQPGVDELEKLFALHQNGALTQDEFNNLKRQLLSKPLN